MKKAVILLSAFCVKVYAEQDDQESLSACMNWKDTIMMHWQALSSVHKLLLAGLIGLAVIWVVWRIVKCGKGGCGCHCADTCTCKI